MKKGKYIAVVLITSLIMNGSTAYAAESEKSAYNSERIEASDSGRSGGSDSDDSGRAIDDDSSDSGAVTDGSTENQTEEPTESSEEQPATEQSSTEQTSTEEASSEQTSEQNTTEETVTEKSDEKKESDSEEKASDTDAAKGTTIGTTGTTVFNQEGLLKLNQQLQELKKDKAQVQQLLNGLMESQNDIIEKLRAMDELIIQYQDEIDELDEKRKIAINTSIDLEEQLKVAEADEAEQYELFKEHIRMDYENNRYTYLDAILNATDFNSVNNELEYIRALDEYDQKLFTDLIETRKEIANKKAMMDVLDENIEAIIEAKVSEQEAMELVCDEKVKQIESYNSKIKEARSALETIEELERKTDEKLLEDERNYRIKLQLNSDNNLNQQNSGSLLWPVDSQEITSPFGGRIDPFTNEFVADHSGVDIACPMNSPVRAPAAGTVIYVGDADTGGRCVKIDIGSNRTVFFYHLNKYNCEVGDTVSAGQVVAYSGSTGRSTAPHLHYGIIVDCELVDPMTFYRQ